MVWFARCILGSACVVDVWNTSTQVPWVLCQMRQSY
jgi:hypothetical protein